MKTVTFSGRVGNSRGGAFLPGTYTVNFYLNGQYFGAKKFEVLGDAGGPYATYPGGSGAIGSSMGTSSMNSGSMLGPTIATGTISGLRRGGKPEMELRLRPQSNGFLHGELVIHQSGFGMTPHDEDERGKKLQFQVPYGTATYHSMERAMQIRSAGPSNDGVGRTRHLDHPDQLKLSPRWVSRPPPLAGRDLLRHA